MVVSVSVPLEERVVVVGNKKKNLPSLTSLRFFAALIVVLLHYNNVIDFPDPLSRISSQGRSGVSFFFVLSGFVLVYNYQSWFGKSVKRYRAFLWARIARIYPAHLVVLLAFGPVLFFYLFYKASIVRDMAGEVTLTLPLFVAAFFATLFLVNDFVPPNIFRSIWNGASWSISAELFFYLLLPFFIVFLNRIRRLQTLLKLAVGLYATQLIIFGIILLLLSNLLPSSESFVDSPTIFFFGYQFPFVRMWEFLIGATCGAIFLHSEDWAESSRLIQALNNPKWRNIILACSIGIVGFIISFPKGTKFGSVDFDILRWYIIYVPFFAIIITTVAFGSNFLTPILERRGLILLGEASYSLYIIHSLPLFFLEVQKMEGHPVPAAYCLLVMVATIIGSIFCYKFVEQPARLFLRKEAKPESPKSYSDLSGKSNL